MVNIRLHAIHEHSLKLNVITPSSTKKSSGNIWSWQIAQIYEELKPYVLRQTELSTQGDVLFCGNIVIIPPAGRQTLLNELHQTHPGIVKMKSLARSV